MPALEDFLKRADPDSDPAFREFEAKPDAIPAAEVDAVLKNAARAVHVMNEKTEQNAA